MNAALTRNGNIVTELLGLALFVFLIVRIVKLWRLKRAAGGKPPPKEQLDDAWPISLGSATSEQLETIEGIGPNTAASIVEFRDQRGGLASVDELAEVSGIGPATIDALRSRLQP